MEEKCEPEIRATQGRIELLKRAAAAGGRLSRTGLSMTMVREASTCAMAGWLEFVPRSWSYVLLDAGREVAGLE